MKKRTVILAVLAVAAAVALYAWREYDRGLEDASDQPPAETVTAAQLLDAFVTDEVAANARFNDKVVEVTGEVKKISPPEAGKVNVTIDTGDALSAIVCEFEEAAAPKWPPGTQVRIKGICAGFNLDVLLQRCAAVE